MPEKFRHRAAVSALAVGAIFSLAFAAEPESSGTGECVGVQAEATVDGTTYGLAGKNCILNTDCVRLLVVGPHTFHAQGHSATVGVWLPDPQTQPFPCLG